MSKYKKFARYPKYSSKHYKGERKSVSSSSSERRPYHSSYRRDYRDSRKAREFRRISIHNQVKSHIRQIVESHMYSDRTDRISHSKVTREATRIDRHNENIQTERKEVIQSKDTNHKIEEKKKINTKIEAGVQTDDNKEEGKCSIESNIKTLIELVLEVKRLWTQNEANITNIQSNLADIVRQEVQTNIKEITETNFDISPKYCVQSEGGKSPSFGNEDVLSNWDETINYEYKREDDVRLEADMDPLSAPQEIFQFESLKEEKKKEKKRKLKEKRKTSKKILIEKGENISNNNDGLDFLRIQNAEKKNKRMKLDRID